MEPEFNNAEDMLRRVSPEGRAIAHRQRMERQRRINRQVALLVLLVIGVSLLSAGLHQMGLQGVAAVSISVLLFFVGAAAIFMGLRPRPLRPDRLAGVPLATVPPRVGEWLEQQRPSLPPPAQPFLDTVSRRLSALEPQLAGLPADGPAAGAIRKLIAVELPDLVGRYRNIPPSVAPEDATAQLVQGLTIIGDEIGRASSELASGSFDALATQNRYLQLKYEAGLGGS